MQDKPQLGNAEIITFPELNAVLTHARIDTGARTSAIWASSIKESTQGLEVVFFGPDSQEFSGEVILFREYSETVVASSNGAAERRYKVRLLVAVGGKRIRAWFTLANRSEQVYPVLIGRNVLRGKFVVDVSLGTAALREREQIRTTNLKKSVEN